MLEVSFVEMDVPLPGSKITKSFYSRTCDTSAMLGKRFVLLSELPAVISIVTANAAQTRE